MDKGALTQSEWLARNNIKVAGPVDILAVEEGVAVPRTGDYVVIVGGEHDGQRGKVTKLSGKTKARKWTVELRGSGEQVLAEEVKFDEDKKVDLEALMRSFFIDKKACISVEKQVAEMEKEDGEEDLPQLDSPSKKGNADDEESGEKDKETSKAEDPAMLEDKQSAEAEKGEGGSAKQEASGQETSEDDGKNEASGIEDKKELAAVEDADAPNVTKDSQASTAAQEEGTPEGMNVNQSENWVQNEEKNNGTEKEQEGKVSTEQEEKPKDQKTEDQKEQCQKDGDETEPQEHEKTQEQEQQEQKQEQQQQENQKQTEGEEKPQSDDGLPGFDDEDCYAAALVSAKTGEIKYAVAAEGEAKPLFRKEETYSVSRMKEDCTMEQVEVDERRCLLEAARGTPGKAGLWIGGEQFSVTSSSEVTIPSAKKKTVSFQMVLANRPGKGVYLARSPGAILVARWKGDHDHNAGNCRWLVYHFIVDLFNKGYFHDINH